MNATGISKQERKIADMAKVVLDLNATLNPLSAKGAFRFAIAECLTEHGYADWRDVSGKTRPCGKPSSTASAPRPSPSS